MVDAAMTARQQPFSDSRDATRRAETAFAVTDTDRDALSAYDLLAGSVPVSAPAQSAQWVGAWVAHGGGDGLFASVLEAGRPVFCLALEVVQSGPFRVARFMGGSHANGNFPLCLAGSMPVERLQALFQAIHAQRPDIDLLRLERLADEIDGQRNPLLALSHRPSPNVALAVDLAGGFEALLARTSAKRKRKKHRSQTRKFDAAGGFRRVTAKDGAEVDRLLQAFLAMKEQRFRKMGIPNVFADRGVQAFFAALFKKGLTSTPPRFVLHGLEVGGKLRAVTGSSLAGSRLVCEFGAIMEDELAFASPGDFLFFENIREAAESGMKLYDFSVGDEPYKRLWCDTEITQYDVLVALSPKGRAYGRVLEAASALKARIKGSPFLWRIVKRLRRQKTATAGVDPDG